MKYSIASFIVLATSLCLGTGIAGAQEAQQDTYLKAVSGENEIRYRLLEDGTLGVVSNPDWLYTGDVVVPAEVTIDGTTYSVTALCGGASGTYGEGSDATSAFNASSVDTANIKSITLPEGLVHIANSAFHTIPIKKLDIPSTVEYIGQMFNMTELTYLRYPDNVESVVANGIYRFSNLETVTFGPNLNKMESPAIVYCPKLRHIYIYAEEPPVMVNDPFQSIGFWDLAIVTVHVPKGCIDAYKEAWGWPDDFEFTFVEFDTESTGIDGVQSDDASADIRVWSDGSGIHVANVTAATPVSLHDILGRTIYSGTVFEDTTLPVDLKSGNIYILKTGNKCTKLITK